MNDLSSPPLIDFSMLLKRKAIEKVLLLLIMSVVIGYLLSPKIIFQPILYSEGDIIRQTIVIEEDLLIPDLVSTKLKKETLLKSLGPFLDYDPGLRQTMIERVGKVFLALKEKHQALVDQEAQRREKNMGLGQEYLENQIQRQLLKQRSAQLARFKGMVEKRLVPLVAMEKLSPRQFEQKKEFDAWLAVANAQAKALAEADRVRQGESAKAKGLFKKARGETKTLSQNIAVQTKATFADFFKSLNLPQVVEQSSFYDIRLYDDEALEVIGQILGRLLDSQVIVSSQGFKLDGETSIQLRDLSTGKITRLGNMDGFMDLEEAKDRAKKQVSEVLPKATPKRKSFLIYLVHNLVSPTISENKSEFERQKAALEADVTPVFFSVKKGEIIARAGERATQHQSVMIRGYYQVLSNEAKLPQILGINLVVLFSLMLVYISFHFRKDDERISFKNLLLIAAAIMISMLLTKGGLELGEMMEARYSGAPAEIFRYLLPVTLSSMLVGILINFEAGLMAGLLTSLFASILMQSNLYYFFFAMMGSIVAALPMATLESRYSLLKQGLKISAVNLPVILVIHMIEYNHIGTTVWAYAGSALAGGVVTAILVSILLPFFESLFDVTTGLKLLELSNMNHPALKQLILKAPGTYQHSIVVGNLAEAGAQRIGANPLLARVGALYHDIGKGVDAEYFIENQPQKGPNIHDRMDPYASARIIIDHLKKGAQIADQKRLGTAIRDVLIQHHGNGIVKYFYNKAVEMAKDQGAGDGQEVDDKEFRYPGPKPQSLEAALVMMADVSEASARSIDEPTPEAIRAMVDKVCWQLLEDGQLDESGLSLKTFRQTLDAFCHALNTIHHNRIKYPAQVPCYTNKKPYL